MVKALEAPVEYYKSLKKSYWEKRDLLNSILQKAGFKTYLPQGSYYIMADITDFGHNDDTKFCEYLIKEVGVAAIPMSAFYPEDKPVKHLIRFCFAKRNEILEKAGLRLSKL